MPKWIGGVFGNPIATTDPISGQKGIFNISDRIYFNEQILQGTGGSISTPGDGYIYHTFISPGTFSINGTGQIEIVAIGGGGGGGGYRAPEPGGGGGAGGIVTALFTLSKASYSVLVGGGGEFGYPANLDGLGGLTGGGGAGGDGFPYGSSGGGGAGGGWSGLRTPTIYYVVAGGGAGGGGSPTANNTAAKGGGVGPFSLVTLRGASGNPSSSGGYGGAGSGFDGSTGGGGNGGTSPISGGSNYANPIGIVSLTDTFSSYTGPNGQANGSARGTRDPSFSTHPMSPAVPTNAGYGGFGGTEIYWTPNSNGIDGIVILRYAENSITDSIDYLK